MAVPLSASIFAKRMRFLPSLAGVIAAVAGLSIAAMAASGEPIPGPPLAVSAGDRAGAFCPLPTSVHANAAGFAAGVLLAAVAARRRDPRV